MRIYAESEKGGRDRYLPITPDFAEWLLSTGEEDRTGRVFRVTSLTSGKPMDSKHVCRIVSAIGRRAGVLVNPADGKSASAHDLRRAFGIRWAPEVKQP